MIIYYSLGIIIGSLFWDLTYSTIECKNDVIDIYYPTEYNVDNLGLEHLLCPFTLNSCDNCDDPAYISRKNYNQQRSWYIYHQKPFQFPPFSNNIILQYDKYD